MQGNLLVRLVGPQALVLRLVLPLVLALSLGACATQTHGLNRDDILAGRMSVQVAASEAGPARGLSGQFELRGHAQAGSMELSGPMGAGAVRASWQAGRYRLETGQQSLEFNSLDELSRAGLGEVLPLAALFDWLRARPWPEAPFSHLADGRSGFEQLGWRIDTADFAQGRLRAQRMHAPTISLRVQLDGPVGP